MRNYPNERHRYGYYYNHLAMSEKAARYLVLLSRARAYYTQHIFKTLIRVFTLRSTTLWKLYSYNNWTL